MSRTDLTERGREELDQKRNSRESEQLDASHWMRCPKCGSRMNEIVQTGICFEKCENCDGVYFDRGELEALIQTEGAQRFLELAMKLWKL